MAARCALRDGYMGKENLGPDRVEQRLHSTHNIKKLADCLNRYMGFLSSIGPENRVDPASWKLLQWLDSEDETGETYRYAMVGKATNSAPARPDQRNLNFYEQVNELHRLAHLLQDGYSAHLDNYEQAQVEELREIEIFGGNEI
jgi:hypothetical protein